ncbi:uncharacterized protein LOC144442219 [Glandiceps talaboti]
MSLPQFTTSTKENSLSLKVRGLKATDTKKLESDSVEMESRLQDLKLMMSREKEERERQGGSYWNSGQPGALTTHADEVLKKSKSKSNKAGEKKARKIKVLKDEPLDKPVRSPTKPFVSTSRSNKSFKGPCCGQCEHKAAALSCMECGEDYCAGCFAQFHLKGALRKHRSVPFQANRGSNSLSESKSMTTSGGNVRTSHNKDLLPYMNKNPSSEETSPNGNSAGGALLQGSYDETQNAADFAAALAEWRQGKQPASISENTTPKSLSPTKRHTVTETSSATDPSPESITPTIEFKENSLSYAERLMLKKHRRTDLSPLHSPSLLGSTTPSTVIAITPVTVSDNLSEEEAELEEEHARYVEMFQPRNNIEPRIESSLSIIEVTESADSKDLEEATTYSVIEDGENEIVVHTTDYEKQKKNSPSKSSASRRDKLSSAKLNKNTDNGALKPTKPSSSRPTSRVTSSSRPTSRAKSGHKSSTDVNKDIVKSNKSEIHDKVEQLDKRSKSRAESRQGKERGKSRQDKRSSSRVDTTKESVSNRPTSARLTTQPSEGLKQVSQLGQQDKHTYKEGLSDFFTTGVKAEDGNRETKKPGDENERLPSEQDVRYSGGPALWRPSSSLSCNLEDINPEIVSGQDFGISDFLKGPSNSNLERAHRFSSTEPPAWPLGSQPPQTWSDDDAENFLRNNPPALPPVRSASNSANTRSVTKSASKERTSAKNRDKGGRESTQREKPPSSAKITERHSASGRRSAAEIKQSKVSQPSKPSTPKKSKGRRRLPKPPSRPSSRIEVDGDDMSRYDDQGHHSQDEDDNETLNQLEWELASQDGRITADGKISRMSVMSMDDIIDEEGNFKMDLTLGDTELGITQDDGHGSGLSSPCEDIDIEKRLSEEDLMADFEEDEKQILADEVKALQS